MKTHLNTLYVQTPGACLGKDGETVRVKIDGAVKLTIPLHHLQGIVCFGRVSVSTSLIAFCSARNVAISFLSDQGRYQGAGPDNRANAGDGKGAQPQQQASQAANNTTGHRPFDGRVIGRPQRRGQGRFGRHRAVTNTHRVVV